MLYHFGKLFLVGLEYFLLPLEFLKKNEPVQSVILWPQFRWAANTSEGSSAIFRSINAGALTQPSASNMAASFMFTTRPY